MNIVLLPGLDGTGILFKPLLKVLPDDYIPVVISYPNDKLMDYNQLADYAQAQIPDGPYIIVAESFSGHVAHIIAERNPPNLQRVHFFSSFLRNPKPLLLNSFTLLFAGVAMKIIPTKLLRKRMIGGHGDNELWNFIKTTINSVPIAIIVQRLKLVANYIAKTKTTTIPYFSVAGESDKLVSPKYTIETPWIDQGESVLISGPHLLLQTRPKRCAEMLNGTEQTQKSQAG
ncbi:MAG: alpha/beta hydrolase [Planctomycetes bacterium]|nr:alpha/beta hydrolase [Planctomycetota bacterium]